MRLFLAVLGFVVLLLASAAVFYDATAIHQTGAQTLAGPVTVTTATAPALSVTGVASGSDALKLLDGQRLNFSTADASAYLYRSAANTIGTPGAFVATGNVYANSFYAATGGYFTSNANPIYLQSGRADGPSSVAVLSLSPPYATPGAKLHAFMNSTLEMANIDHDGMPQIGIGNTTAAPTCSAAQRGKIWFINGATLVKDSATICAKDAADAYAWRTLY